MQINQYFDLATTARHEFALDSYIDTIRLRRKPVRIIGREADRIRAVIKAGRASYEYSRSGIVLDHKRRMIRSEILKIEKPKSVEIKKIGGITFFRLGRFGGSFYLKKPGPYDPVKATDRNIMLFMGIVVCSAILVSLFS